ncbi:hypothetical protein Kpol_218p2 [Vanderwaltozyma polyspora DSM 70294]|uniref:Trafficking protein particle complex II-specific subunit 120 n=1 Tax=Vanderwaltozyma polyspora (strain ATCC 22028 / DSM 70294 / BCRC 21397 / CBS 2163 / NBRC 10782 / NRRL Y-8283 / UCD 57-17) TaxID=436907 RepID=A7TTI8_VANPO|nr:uncharacterized protein Kpol_218p2 [Vanderwaltozyma polyspora DSM 70294]EDO14417.1 hypothetical protein Kpol_218p2 [Vanderwaltozyma polyspora DSM 70294]
MNSLGTYSSFVDPAKVHTLVVPIGKWEVQKFKSAVELLKDVSEIRLLDISAIESLLFTPQGFPHGRIFLDIITSANNEALDLFLYDFEPFRKIFIVIGLVNDESDPSLNLETLKEKFPAITSQNLIYTSNLPESFKAEELETGNVFRWNMDQVIQLEAIMCDISRNFLLALDRYYSSYKHVTLRSPGAIGGSTVLKTTLTTTAGSQVKTNISSKSSNASKRLSTFEKTTSNLKRSASLQIARSLSTSDNKAQQRSQGRQLKILGNFQLLSGRYVDALNSFTEAVVLLHIVRDNLWLGSALDGIAICFILLSYLEVSFHVPSAITELCPIHKLHSDSIPSTPRNSVTVAPMLSSPRNSVNSSSSVPDLDIKNVNLPFLIKAISDKILHYYNLTLSQSSEYVPQTVYCDILLKTLTFMTACKSGPNLESTDLKTIVHGLHSELSESNSEVPTFSKMEIYGFASKLFELQLKDMEILVQRNIYYTLAEIYGLLGFTRKKSFVLRLLLVTLVATAQNTIWTSDYHCLLEKMTRLYGIDRRMPEISIDDASKSSWLTFQKKALQLCLTVSERVRDYDCISKFSLLLITRYTHLLTRMEQEKILNTNILPMIESSFISKYWDPFLLREVSLVRNVSNFVTNSSDSVNDNILLKKNEFMLNSNPNDGQQVFNPFRHTRGSSVTDSTLNRPTLQGTFLVGDIVDIMCKFQNPFKFDIQVYGIKLSGNNAKYATIINCDLSENNPMVLSAESFTSTYLKIKLLKPTFEKHFTISSLSLSIMGLKYDDFEIVLTENKSKSTSMMINDRRNLGDFSIKILPEQPELHVVKASDMIENKFMFLEGTKQKSSIVLKNKSLNSSVDYISIKQISNIEQSLKSDYWKNVLPDELYDMEMQLENIKEKALKIIRCPKSIKPNEIAEVEFEIDTSYMPFELTDIEVTIEYGQYLENTEDVYVKQLKLPYNFTLKRSIEVTGILITQLKETFPDSSLTVDWIGYIMGKLKEDKNKKISDYALVMIDMRNSWIDGIKLNFTFKDYCSQEYFLEGGHTTRIIVPVERLDFNHRKFYQEPIPKIFKGRQFIQSGLSEEEISDMRVNFWCREYVINNLNCLWNLSTGNLSGDVNFRQFVEKFDPKMVNSIYKGCSQFDLNLSLSEREVNIGSNLIATVSLNLQNIEKEDLTPLFVNFTMVDSRCNIPLPKVNNRILYNGILCQPLFLSTEEKVQLEMTPIEKGDYEISVSISEDLNGETIIPNSLESVSFKVN